MPSPLYTPVRTHSPSLTNGHSSHHPDNLPSHLFPRSRRSPDSDSIRPSLCRLTSLVSAAVIAALIAYAAYQQLHLHLFTSLPPSSLPLPLPLSLTPLTHAPPALTPSAFLASLPIPTSPLPAACLTMDWPGRFGNNLFQLMFLLTMSSRHHLRPYISRAFTLYDQLTLSMLVPVQPCPTSVILNDGTRLDPPYSTVDEDTVTFQFGNWSDLPPNLHHRITGQGDPRHYSVFYNGWFQNPSAGYDRSVVLQLARPRPDLEAKLVQLWYSLLAGLPPHTLVMALHVRQGDYRDEEDAVFRRIPLPWFYTLLDRLHANSSLLVASLAWQEVERRRLAETALPFIPTTPRFCLPAAGGEEGTVEKPRLCPLLVSDELQMAKQMREAGHVVVTPDDVLCADGVRGEAALALGGSEDVRGVYKDWWFLTRPQVTAISHSSFSYTATLFNEWQGVGHFFWPNGSTHQFERYDPWNSHFYSRMEPWMAREPVPAEPRLW